MYELVTYLKQFIAFFALWVTVTTSAIVYVHSFLSLICNE